MRVDMRPHSGPRNGGTANGQYGQIRGHSDFAVAYAHDWGVTTPMRLVFLPVCISLSALLSQNENAPYSLEEMMSCLLYNLSIPVL